MLFHRHDGSVVEVECQTRSTPKNRPSGIAGPHDGLMSGQRKCAVWADSDAYTDPAHDSWGGGRVWVTTVHPGGTSSQITVSSNYAASRHGVHPEGRPTRHYAQAVLA